MPILDRRELMAIFAGGAVGALVRIWLGLQFASGAAQWPWATFAINVSGCFALAYMATLLHERVPASTYRRRLLETGFCGAYTTFSTMQIEILRILEAHRYGLALGYALTSVAAGYAAIWAATTLGRRAQAIA